MMKIVILTGSNKQEATITRLADYAGELMAQQGNQIRSIHLYQSPLPFYSDDADVRTNEAVRYVQQSFNEADAIVLATPEYHGSLIGSLKNALDHMGQEQFSGKAVLSISSSGGVVGVSSLIHLQSIVRNLHGINCSEWISISGPLRSRFDGASECYEGAQEVEDRIQRVIHSFVRLAQLLVQDKGIPGVTPLEW